MPAASAPATAAAAAAAANDQVVQWSNQAVESAYSELLRASPAFATMGMPAGAGCAGQSSLGSIANNNANNTLARRPASSSRALVPAQRQPYAATNVDWTTALDGGGGGGGGDLMSLQGPPNEVSEHDNLEKMEEAALKAKREATAKRKQIPPFVQKLSR
jgi:heat shock transcription factor